MNWFTKLILPNVSTEREPVFVLGPRSSGKTIFLASLYNARGALKVVKEDKSTRKWKEETMRVFFEALEPTRTDFLDYSSVDRFKDEAKANFANPTDDPDFFKRIMLDIGVRFPSDETTMHRVSLPDPSGELFVQSNLLENPGYAAYVNALRTAAGYIIIVGADAETCRKGSGSQATAVQRVLHKLADHAADSDYITRPVSVVLMKMDQHMDCCLDCDKKSGPERADHLRKAGLDNDRMGDLFERWFHPINRQGIESIVDEGRLRYYGVSAYGFAKDGSPACTLASNTRDFVPTPDARPINIAEPLKWALGVD